MNYVESFKLFGTEAMQIPCIKGDGAPTTSTPGAVGCLYMDTSSEFKDLYKCTAAVDGVYTWVSLLGDISAALDGILAIQEHYMTTTESPASDGGDSA